MINKYDADIFFTNIADTIDKSELEIAFPSHFYDAYFKGKRTITQKTETELKRFDVKWIETVESYIPSIDLIARNAKSNLREETEVVPVELAKNISSESITYLLNHTEDIKEVNGEEVIPQRILTTVAEIDYGIYENRFIMTLIGRLKDFVNERIKVMDQQLKATKKISFNVDSNFTYEEADYKITVNIDQIEDYDRKK